MTSRRVIPGVLHGLLGTFTSRNSDLHGYWVFGFLVEGMEAMRIDLLDEVNGSREPPPFGFVSWLAARKFGEQLVKAGLPREWIREAYLDLSRPAEGTMDEINGRTSFGSDVRFQAHVVTDLGRIYEKAISVFVAPHDPEVESRSGRAESGSAGGAAWQGRWAQSESSMTLNSGKNRCR